jgi:RNA polymerase sigma-70 factor (ECF subfamily)
VSCSAETIEELLHAVAAAEPEAFARLHHLARRRVRAVVLRTLVDPWQTDEVTQDVFLEIWQKAAQFDTRRGSGMSWILTIATRRAIDRVRSAYAARERDIRDAARNYDHPRDHVWEAVESRFDQEQLLRQLAQVTPLQREALTLRYLHGRTIAETAEDLGASQSAVKARVSDGIAQLRGADWTAVRAA